MSTPTLTSRTKADRRSRPLIAVMLLALLGLLLVACTPEQRAVIDQVNASRTDAGEQTLLPHPSLITRAQTWADTMAAEGRLQHSDHLGVGIPTGWSAVGENVGTGSSLEAIHDAFMASSSHRANLLDSRFDTIGTGVAQDADGVFWVVHLFADYGL